MRSNTAISVMPRKVSPNRLNSRAARQQSPALGPAQRAEMRMIAKSIMRSEQEEKYFQFGFVPASALSTGTVVPISQVTQGNTAYTRIGDRIHPKRLLVKYSVVASANTVLASADQYDNVRVILLRWHDDSTPALPVLADILTNATNTDYTIANYNRDQAPRYKILYDVVHVLVNTPIWNGTTALYEVGPSSVATQTVDISKGLGTPCDYRGTATTGSEQFFILFVSNSAFTPHPQFEMQSEITFHDD